jgi:hypothetical protein
VRNSHLHSSALGQWIHHVQIAASLAEIAGARGEPRFGINFHDFGGGDKRDSLRATSLASMVQLLICRIEEKVADCIPTDPAGERSSLQETIIF